MILDRNRILFYAKEYRPLQMGTVWMNTWLFLSFKYLQNITHCLNKNVSMYWGVYNVCIREMSGNNRTKGRNGGIHWKALLLYVVCKISLGDRLWWVGAAHSAATTLVTKQSVTANQPTKEMHENHKKLVSVTEAEKRKKYIKQI